MNKTESIFNIISLEEVDSTNNYAKAICEDSGITEWTVVNTRKQTAGRGQQNNIWESEGAMNLTFSVILRPGFIPPSRQFILNKAISLGVTDFLRKENICNISVKWPNDIYVVNKKIAGILIENSIAGDSYSRCIAGIGININQVNFPESAGNPTSMKIITSNDFDRMQCLHKLLECLHFRYEQLKTQSEIINNDYLNSLYLLGKPAKYRINGKITEAVILGTDETGFLKLQLPDNQIKHCDLKEVVFMNNK